MICQSVFGLFLRRHHCRACGRLICSKCSVFCPLKIYPCASMETRIDSTQQQATVRICTECEAEEALRMDLSLDDDTEQEDCPEIVDFVLEDGT